MPFRVDKGTFQEGRHFDGVFDLEQNRELSLMEYPLIVMECSVLGEKHMGLPPDEAYDYMV
jgi:hypothetical protein